MDTKGVKNSVTSFSTKAKDVKNASAGRVFSINGPKIPNRKGGLGPDSGLTVCNK